MATQGLFFVVEFDELMIRKLQEHNMNGEVSRLVNDAKGHLFNGLTVISLTPTQLAYVIKAMGKVTVCSALYI